MVTVEYTEPTPKLPSRSPAREHSPDQLNVALPAYDEEVPSGTRDGRLPSVEEDTIPPAYTPTPSESGALAHDATSYPADVKVAETEVQPLSPGTARGAGASPLDPFQTNSSDNVDPIKRPLCVPSANMLPTSGFPYPSNLRASDVSPDEWARFTAEITAAARMSAADWAITFGSGVGTFIVTGTFLSWFGVIPAALVGRKVRAKLELKNLKKGVKGGTATETANVDNEKSGADATDKLDEKLKQWNADYFAPRGLFVAVALPGERLAEMADIDMVPVADWKMWHRKNCTRGHHERCASESGMKASEQLDLEDSTAVGRGKRSCRAKRAAKCEQRDERRMMKEVLKGRMKEDVARWRAAKKGRIIVLPLEKGDAESRSEREDEREVEVAERKELVSVAVV